MSRRGLLWRRVNLTEIEGSTQGRRSFWTIERDRWLGLHCVSDVYEDWTWEMQRP